MQVFGDAAEQVDPRERLGTISLAAAPLIKIEGERARYWALCELFIDVAELAQGLADAEFEGLARDADFPLRAAATGLLMAVAGELAGSPTAEADRGSIASAVAALSPMELPDRIWCRRAEGYAFYAIYPEAYLQAAKALGVGAPVRTIGIRSIGLGLAALVAAACGAPAPVSVRPVGHPFQRRLALDPDLQVRLLQRTTATHYAIADEGPGLSGSSFAAVIDLLDAAGVPEADIHLFPSHTGTPGPEAPAPQLARWNRLQKHVVGFDELFLTTGDADRRLENWFADLVGPATEPLRDISGGQWRGLTITGAWPPAHVQQERRKFLLTTAKGTFLLKFIGLGRYGREKFPRARALHEAGFVPELLAFRHGFSLERWEDAQPAKFSRLDRGALIEKIANYLAFRARHFAVPNAPGATLGELADMLRQNATEALGPEFATPLEQLCALIPRTPPRRVATDNRLHAWEWLQTSDGRLLKTDALDHCAAHDLVGCQDPAWDIVGAGVELDLSKPEQQELAARVGRLADAPIDPELLRLLAPCYLAFQLGYYTMATGALSGMPEEHLRLRRRADLYRDRLTASLAELL